MAERAILRSGYLVDLTLIVSVPAQRLANGRPAAHGIEGERLAVPDDRRHRRRVADLWRSGEALARLEPGPQDAGDAITVEGGVAVADLVELGPLQEEVHVVLPGEADAAVHLQAGGHHAP